MSPVQIHDKYAPATVFIKTDTGAGTGFVLSPDGTIATAFHVIGDAKKVAVKTGSGEIFDTVQLVAADERKDLAILKVAGFDLPAVELENSNEAKVGERVTVMGNPLGTEKLQSTVTDGILSGVRDFGWGYKVVQISAPISPGNSGGPVFSTRGKVIGIAAFKLVGGESLNFAVPSNYLRGLLEMADKSHPVRVWNQSLSESTFSPRNGAVTGTWKSTCGPVYQIEDKTTTVRILNIRNLDATYDLRWEKDVIFGMVSGSETAAEWFLVKVSD